MNGYAEDTQKAREAKEHSGQVETARRRQLVDRKTLDGSYGPIKSAK